MEDPESKSGVVVNDVAKTETFLDRLKRKPSIATMIALFVFASLALKSTSEVIDHFESIKKWVGVDEVSKEDKRKEIARLYAIGWLVSVINSEIAMEYQPAKMSVGKGDFDKGKSKFIFDYQTRLDAYLKAEGLPLSSANLNYQREKFDDGHVDLEGANERSGASRALIRLIADEKGELASKYFDFGFDMFAYYYVASLGMKSRTQEEEFREEILRHTALAEGFGFPKFQLPAMPLTDKASSIDYLDLVQSYINRVNNMLHQK